ncbi:MAG: hypothetical protein ABFD59_08290 [Smithella sp.]
MAAEVVIGADEFTEQPVRRVYSQGQGWKTVRTWIGPQALTSAKEDDILLMSPAPEGILTTEGVPAQIEATFSLAGGSSGIPDLIDEQDARWELLGEDLEKDIATHGYYNVSGSTAAIIEEIDEQIKKGKARNFDWDTLYPSMNMQSYCNHKLRGMDDYVTFAYIIRKTITTSSTTLLEEDFSAVPGKIISWGDIGVPSSAKFKQPKIHCYETDAWVDKLVSQWMVKAPSVRWQKGKRLWELTREWWGAEKWSSALYDGGSFTP